MSLQPPADGLHVPDGAAPAQALARTTDLAVVAHPDDLELLVTAAIVACAEDSQRWFTGVVCTDGAGSLGTPDAPSGSAVLVNRRADEQRTAADLGSYSAVAMLAHPSTALVDPESAGDVVDQLVSLFRRCTPTTVYTHAPTDQHHTHVAVCLLCLAALRCLAPDERPTRLLAVEGWGGLDWLDDHDLVRLDATGGEELSSALARCFTTQLANKRYDLAARGRRQANATLATPRGADDATEVNLAMDLTPLIADDELDPVVFVGAAIDRFRSSTLETMARLSRRSR